MARISLTICILIGLISCTGDEASSSSPESLAKEAAGIYRGAIRDARIAIETPDPEPEIDGIIKKTRGELLSVAREAYAMEQQGREAYSMTYSEYAFEGLDSVMIPLITFKDSLKQTDPLNILALKLEDLMGISAYGDFDILRRIAPKEFETYSKD